MVTGWRTAGDGTRHRRGRRSRVVCALVGHRWESTTHGSRTIAACVRCLEIVVIPAVDSASSLPDFGAFVPTLALEIAATAAGEDLEAASGRVIDLLIPLSRSDMHAAAAVAIVLLANVDTRPSPSESVRSWADRITAELSWKTPGEP